MKAKEMYQLIILIIIIILGLFAIFGLWKLFIIGFIFAIITLSIIYFYITQKLGEVIKDERIELIEIKSFYNAVRAFGFFILILYVISIFYKNILESALFHGMLVALGIITILYFVFKLHYSKKL